MRAYHNADFCSIKTPSLRCSAHWMYQIHCKTPNENPRIHIFLEKVENYRSGMGIYSIGLDF